MNTGMRTTASIIAALVLVASGVVAQEPSRSVLFPAPAAAWDVIGSIGATVTILPRPIAEEEIRQIPLLDLGVRVGLPHGFSLLGGIATNVLTTSAAAGAEWSYRYGKYSVAIGDRHSFWYGTAQIEGFDASAIGWMNHPFVTLGADYTEVRLVARAEATLVLYRSTRVGDEEVSTESNLRSGTAFMLAIEQPFIDRTEVSIGLRLNITDSAVQSWLAFTTLRDKLIYPEILVSVLL